MAIKSITQIKNLAGQRVLVRVDFNVPVKNGRVIDDYKIQKSLLTLEQLSRRGAKIALISHLGRPQGVEGALSLRPIKNHLEKLLQRRVGFIKATNAVKMLPALARGFKQLPNGGFLCLENIRFFTEERNKVERFGHDLAETADLFVSECFAVTHHSAPSISGIPKYLPSYAGRLLNEEITVLSRVMTRPKKPLVVMLGGAKAETKIPALKNLLPQASQALVSGVIFNTYLWAKGYKVGGSFIQPEFKKEVLKYCGNKKVILPVDVIIGQADGSEARVVSINSGFRIRNSELGIYDIGPATIRLFARYIKNGQTLIMNGAAGRFEVHPYEYGTYALADLFAARSRGRAFGVAGGGETVQILRKRGIMKEVDLVSTGGGAMLEFLSGKKLPGIEALRHA